MPRTKTCQAAVARLGECNQPVEGGYFCARHWRAWDWREAEIDRLKKMGYLPAGNVLNVGKQLDEYERLLTDEPK